jgi:pimeloyl-ACP methyl ester carboxylesterase
MAIANVDGIPTHYDLVGSGPPLLMFSPGGFDASLDTWRTHGVYARLKPLDHLAAQYTCIVFDRREAGHSGGRVEPIAWGHYAAQGKGLLDHLGIERVQVIGGSMGCAVAAAFAVAYPDATSSVVLWWPLGGARFRIRAQQRFAEHLAFVQQHGLDGVVNVVRNGDKGFGTDARGGPWASVIRHDRGFADAFADLDLERYKLVVAGMCRRLFDRDTVPGAEPEDLLRLDLPALVVPGHDEWHATSAARYLEECLPGARYWNVPIEEQTEDASSARLLEFLAGTPG